MKTLHKLMLVAIAAIFAFGHASADFRMGVKAGLNFNKLHYSNLPSYLNDADNRTGWQAGLMAEFTVPIVNIGMDASILYSRQNLDNDEILKNKDYLDIPVNLKWKIGIPVIKNIVSPLIYTGPDFLVALNKKTFDNIKTKTCEVGWNLGAGVELFKHLQLQAGYTWGLNSLVNITDQAGIDLGIHTEDYKVKKNYWTLTAAYLF